ncbi:MAG: CBS domain-containing protein [Acidobacteria bacterium]|nr:CBS domain-containing protein [Acidobacteriota bacterium]
MQVKDIMTPDPKFCRVDNNLAEATELMWANNCGALPVMDEEGKVIGMITDRDICIALGTRNQRPSEVHVGEVTEWKLFPCSPQDDIHDALSSMRAWKVRRLPVLNKNGALEGILSLNDAAIHAAKRPGGDLTYQDVADTLKAICEHMPAESRHAAA